MGAVQLSLHPKSLLYLKAAHLINEMPDFVDIKPLPIPILDRFSFEKAYNQTKRYAGMSDKR